MKSATVESVCECQARLYAVLDEQRHALRGWARQRGRDLSAPANVVGATGESLNVGWSCPFCTRNTLRAFHHDALVYRDGLPSKFPPAPAR